MNGIGEIGEKLRRSTVHIETVGRGHAGSGSGVIWNASGLVITNSHVSRSDSAKVQLWDGRVVSGTVTRRNPARDLAAIQISASALEPAQLGDSDSLRPGEWVVAVGNPLGFQGAMSTGVIHAVGPLRGLANGNWVQAAIRLAPGNSGGPLGDAHSRVIGINTMVAGNLGLAIPSNTVKRFLTAAEPARLGITVRPVPVRSNKGAMLGLMVLGVEPGGAADRASLLLGDVLLRVDGRTFSSPADLSEFLEQTRGVIHLEFVRGGKRTVREVAVKVGAVIAEAA